MGGNASGLERFPDEPTRGDNIASLTARKHGPPLNAGIIL